MTDAATPVRDDRAQALIESYDRRGNWRRGRYAVKFEFDGYLVTVSKEPLDPLVGYDGGTAWCWSICRGEGMSALARSDCLWATSVQAEAEAFGALLGLIQS